METSRISIATSLSSTGREQRQAQARIRALQRRTNALYEDLSRSSFVAKTAVHDFKQTYTTITNEFREQRDQLLQRLYHVKRDIRRSTTELDNIHQNLHTVQSFHPLKSSSMSSNDFEIHQINDMIDDIDRVLNKIAQHLKSLRFMPSNDQAISKTFGTMHIKETDLRSVASYTNQYYSTNELSVNRLYTIDLDISPQWVVSSIDKRIFLCDTEGAVRVFSYSRSFRRQPLLTEHFSLATMRLISSFTVTQDYLIAFETDTQTLTLHTHHGGILLRLSFPYDPIMMTHCGYHKNNRIWTCSHTKRECYQFNFDHTMKEIEILDEIDFTEPISNILIDPIGVSTDEHNRVAIHHANPATIDHLFLFTNGQCMSLSLDFIKYLDSRSSSSRIERVLLIPKHPNLIVIAYASKASITSLHEILIVDISLQPAQILYHLSEVNGVQSLDVTLNSELVYIIPTQKNKRVSAKMHIYSLFD